MTLLRPRYRHRHCGGRSCPSFFEEFAQVHHAMQSRVKGTGLRPAAFKEARGVARRPHRGWKAPGQGSLFSLTVPRAYRGADESDPAEENWVVEAGRIPVLVLENDPADSRAIGKHLNGTPYQPIFARTVAAAKRAMAKINPTVALLDVVLDGEETWRMLMSLRAGPETSSNIPIVVMSSAGDDRKALHLGADAYLPKPIASNVLLEILDRLTGIQSVTKVLLVDDEEVTRYLVQQLLPRGSYFVREATSGAQGLAELQRDPPDVVLMDLKMPEMSGFELLERISGDAALDRVPAIITHLGDPRTCRSAPASPRDGDPLQIRSFHARALHGHQRRARP